MLTLGCSQNRYFIDFSGWIVLFFFISFSSSLFDTTSGLYSPDAGKVNAGCIQSLEMELLSTGTTAVALELFITVLGLNYPNFAFVKLVVTLRLPTALLRLLFVFFRLTQFHHIISMGRIYRVVVTSMLRVAFGTDLYISKFFFRFDENLNIYTVNQKYYRCFFIIMFVKVVNKLWECICIHLSSLLGVAHMCTPPYLSHWTIPCWIW